MNQTLRMNRRFFVIGSAAVGSGLALGLRLPSGPDAAIADASEPEVNAWVVIRPDETVVIRVAKSEMGQGTITGLAQLVAEELECDWSKVATEYPTPGQNLARKQVWGTMFTAGSRGIRESQELVRKGGAAARQMLIQAAANSWNVHASECSAASGVIRHGPSGRTTTFGKVADAAGKLETPKDIQLKDPKDWKIAGKPLKRLDTVDKLTGKLVYGIDVKLPGMLNAAIKDCPVFGGRLKSFDAEKVRGMKGVRKVVPVGESGVAVVADTWWQAKTALDALPIEWDQGDNAKTSSASIAEWLKAGLDAEQAFVGNQNGDAKAALASATKTVEAVYSYPYQNHATMEPMNTTVLYTADKCEVWCPTQNGDTALAAVIEASGLPAGKCDVHKVPLGGGFGRRTFTDYIKQAVAIAKETPGTPVKLLWSREEDMTHGHYHPVTQAKMTGGFDANGTLHCVAHADLRTIDSRLGTSRETAEWTRSGYVPGSQPRRSGKRDRLHHSQSADRPFNAESVCSSGLLAGGEHQPKRHLSRVLHRRTRPIDWARPAGVPAQADDTASQTSRRAQRGCGEDWLGKIPAARDSPRDCADDVFRQLRGGRC